MRPWTPRQLSPVQLKEVNSQLRFDVTSVRWEGLLVLADWGDGEKQVAKCQPQELLHQLDCLPFVIGYHRKRYRERKVT